MKDVEQYLPTMGINIDQEMPEQARKDFALDARGITFFGGPFPALGSAVPRTSDEKQRAVDLYVGDTLSQNRLADTFNKYME